MGVAIQEGSRGGKKAVDAELNLVPFIDLLVCCICFLLITAVWMPMARVDVQQRTPGVGKTAAAAKDKPVKLLIGDDGYVVAVGSQRRVILKEGRTYDNATLARTLRDLRIELRQGPPMMNVVVEDGVSYRQIIEAIDIVKSERFSAVSVSSSGLG